MAEAPPTITTLLLYPPPNPRLKWGQEQMRVPKSGLVTIRVPTLPPAPALHLAQALNRLFPYLLKAVKNRPPCAFGSPLERSNGFAAPGKRPALHKPGSPSDTQALITGLSRPAPSEGL